MRFLPKIALSVILLAIGGLAFSQPPANHPMAHPADASAQQSVNPQQPSQQANSPQPATGGAAAQPQPFGGRRGQNGFGRPGGSGAQYSMSFDNADIQSVVKFLSMISKVPIVVDPDLKGNVTIVAQEQMSLQDAYEVINAALRVRGYGMVGGLDSKVIRVVPLKKAIVDASGVESGKEMKDGIADQDLVTQVVSLSYASSDALQNQLKPLVSADEASLVSVSATNTLIITDHASNVKRLMEIIKDCDVDTTGVIACQVYQCKYASADNLVTTLNTLFQVNSNNGTSMPGQPQGGRFRGGMPGVGGPGAPGNGTPQLTGGMADLRGHITFSSDARTNQLIISATREHINVVLDLLKQLDVDTLPEVKVKCFPLAYADAQSTADQLNSMFEQPQGGSSSQSGRGFSFFFGGGSSTTPTAYAGLKRNVVVADVRTNSVIVTATDQNMRVFEGIIKDLDTPQVLSQVTKVYKLKFAHSDNLAATLKTLFQGNTATGYGANGRVGGIAAIFGLANSSQNNDSPLVQLQQITVVSEPKTNAILVTGPPSAFPLMDNLVKELDVRTAQVFIEAAIVDVTLDKEDQFGVEWQWQDSKNNASTNFGLGLSQSSSSQNNGGGLSTGLKYSIVSNNLQALLRALETKNNVKVLSTPTVTTADNVQALISIGEDIPLPTSTLTTGGTQINSFNYQPVSIALTVTPHVNNSGSDVIGLDVNQQINEIAGTDPTTKEPIIAQRTAQTSITVKDGQTIVIGGIIQDSTTKGSQGIPILSSIPLLGNLFKFNDNQHQKTELMVFITPRILKTEEDIQDVTGGTERRLSTQPPAGAASLKKPST